jgi:hypothetical protein
MELEEKKLNEFTMKVNQFGVKNFGAEFHNKINQNTKASMALLTDPDLPRMKEYTPKETIVLNVRNEEIIFFLIFLNFFIFFC